MAPQNVGIKALEVYIPSSFVNQEELEKFDGIPAGKYTIGLGQTNMAFVNDREDIYSLSLTATSRLLKNYNIDPNSIGRLEVGTETLLDKSKSVKSVLMQLFGDNDDIEGVDTVNACYGGTSAVINAVNWIESSSWDGRDAIVVAGDIAIYAKGAARPTGGVGSVAMLIGPDAPIVFDSVRGSHMEHAYDFYKPDFTSEYPVVDGHFSLTCYTKSLDHAYKNYSKKVVGAGKTVGLLDYFDYSAFHVPTCKLVTKSFARLLYNDFVANPEAFKEKLDKETFDQILALTYEQSLTDRNLEKVFLGLAKQESARRLTPALKLATNTGNMYTASCWTSLSSVLYFIGNEELQGKRISIFSYGSGLASTLLSVKVVGDISNITKVLDLEHKLGAGRKQRTPQEYVEAIELREKAHLQKSFQPTGSVDDLSSGTYYLVDINDKFQRKYEVKN
ncbi:hypothetical protein PUMCH_004124 [Australozyma saopauloensis]|uniref:Hydroxymethylglutaryl-CoA synthase n=1 Tax=Australozyma saopauloensis TaxID=291208 RepID=A0AAX4HE10_9ASCO|nr:hypothetical protein PUMCH_004124 [[Candida] saopauloensis]